MNGRFCWVPLINIPKSNKRATCWPFSWEAQLVRGAQPGQEIKPAVVYGGTPMSKDKEMLKDAGDALVGLSRSLDSSIYTFFKNRRYSRYSATIFAAQILCVFLKVVLGRSLGESRTPVPTF